MSSARRALILLAVAASCAPAPGAARADGDPASDFLIAQQVFFGFGKTSASEQAELQRLVEDAKAKGFEVRVALVGSRTDLGAVPVLWRRPQTYARFLGQELALYYPRRLLIVMPNGYGIYRRHGGVPPAEKAALGRLPAPGTDLVGAAERAVQQLAAVHGVEVKPRGSSGRHSQNRERLEIVAIVLVVLVALAIVKGVRLLRRPTVRDAAR